VIATTRFNDWGPYDYHRDYNLTYPQQLIGDVSYVLGRAQWFDVPETRFGVRGTWRTLNTWSPRYCPARTADVTGSLVCDPTASGPDGREWEIRSYVNIGF
jgi:beta-galactosidase